MIIIGIDPGYAIVGYGVVNYVGNKFTVLDYGAITTSSTEEYCDRVEHIYDELVNIINIFKPEVMGIEQLFFNSNSSTAIAVAQARGIILLSGQKAGLKVFECTPLQVKQSVTGYGKAVKQQVQEMTRIILNLQKTPKPDDIADALAVAICTAHSCGSLMFNHKNARLTN